MIFFSKSYSSKSLGRDTRDAYWKIHNLVEIKLPCSRWNTIRQWGLTKFPLNSINFVGIIKEDMVELFNDFYENSFDVSRINYGVIILLPKVTNANKIQ
jgi:hypothetical protein